LVPFRFPPAVASLQFYIRKSGRRSFEFFSIEASSALNRLAFSSDMIRQPTEQISAPFSIPNRLRGCNSDLTQYSIAPSLRGAGLEDEDEDDDEDEDEDEAALSARDSFFNLSSVICHLSFIRASGEDASWPMSLRFYWI
jgi:hypothetical protein